MWRYVDFVWTDISEEHIASIFSVKVRELETSVSRWLQKKNYSAATWSRWFLARGLFYPEDGGDPFLRNVG
jgi:hypothetical protein